MDQLLTLGCIMSTVRKLSPSFVFIPGTYPVNGGTFIQLHFFGNALIHTQKYVYMVILYLIRTVEVDPVHIVGHSRLELWRLQLCSACLSARLS